MTEWRTTCGCASGKDNSEDQTLATLLGGSAGRHSANLAELGVPDVGDCLLAERDRLHALPGGAVSWRGHHPACVGADQRPAALVRGGQRDADHRVDDRQHFGGTGDAGRFGIKPGHQPVSIFPG